MPQINRATHRGELFYVDHFSAGNGWRRNGGPFRTLAEARALFDQSLAEIPTSHLRVRASGGTEGDVEHALSFDGHLHERRKPRRLGRG
jgi:hypothetical protein